MFFCPRVSAVYRIARPFRQQQIIDLVNDASLIDSPAVRDIVTASRAQISWPRRERTEEPAGLVRDHATIKRKGLPRRSG